MHAAVKRRKFDTFWGVVKYHGGVHDALLLLCVFYPPDTTMPPYYPALFAALCNSYARLNTKVILHGMSLVDNSGSGGSVIVLISSQLETHQVGQADSRTNVNQTKGKLIRTCPDTKTRIGDVQRILSCLQIGGGHD